MNASPHTADLEWSALLSDYRAKHTVWLESGATESEMASYAAALASLPAPSSPTVEIPEEMRDMTVGSLLAISTLEAAPLSVKAWASHHRDYEAWEKQRAALHQQFLGEADRREEAANQAYFGALDTVAKHRVSTLAMLVEKIEIIDADYCEGAVPHERVAQILADVRNLAVEAAHG